MTKTMMLLAASTALTAALGIPAWSAMQTPAQTESVVLRSAEFAAGDDAFPQILADNDESDAAGGRLTRTDSDDDDDDEEEDDDACDDGEGSCGARSAAPVPAGSVAPPQNGLFGTGTPQVQVK